MLPADHLWALLYDEYFPFTLRSEHRNGVSYEQLALRTGMPLEWIEERVAAADACLESGGKLAAPRFDRRQTRRREAA